MITPGVEVDVDTVLEVRYCASDVNVSPAFALLPILVA